MSEATNSRRYPADDVLAELLRRTLPGTTPVQRAAILVDVAQVVYDHVKHHAPEGQGFDGRDGPERRGLAAVVDAAKDYQDKVERGGHAP